MNATHLGQRRSHLLRQAWDGRAKGWHEHVTDTPAFEAVRNELFDRARPRPSDEAVDLGAGTGFITLPLSARVKDVLAVDVSGAMLEALQTNAASAGCRNVRTLAADLDDLGLREHSVDLIVSSYALHHLTDSQKSRLLERSFTWLRPGGRIVIADMMLGRGLSSRDRKIAQRKVMALLRRGPGGVWRIVKNVFRFTLRVGTERPVPPQQWVRMMRAAGFDDVQHADVVAEAGLVWGTRPPSPIAG